MKPQLRPFSAITSKAIWSSATHWMLLYAHAPFAICSKCYDYEESQAKHGLAHQIYPFAYHEATGEIVALPWPLMPGEVEIPQWRGKTTALDEDVVDIINDCYWWTDSKGQHHSVTFRVDERPSPRRRINPDGTETFVWVWEADR